MDSRPRVSVQDQELIAKTRKAAVAVISHSDLQIEIPSGRIAEPCKCAAWGMGLMAPKAFEINRLALSTSSIFRSREARDFKAWHSITFSCRDLISAVLSYDEAVHGTSSGSASGLSSAFCKMVKNKIDLQSAADLCLSSATKRPAENQTLTSVLKLIFLCLQVGIPLHKGLDAPGQLSQGCPGAFQWLEELLPSPTLNQTLSWMGAKSPAIEKMRCLVPGRH